ncbi:MAG TPA: hypothetical protein VM848_16595 [Acidimicrobiia bacterium]|nr:hypothetical protein [Acidimicrobiia bacterium]
MVWLTVPAGRDEVTTQWLSSVFGPVQSFTIEQIGEDFGLSGSTFKVDLRLIDAPPRQTAIKFASSGPTAREITFFEHCAAGTPLRLPEFVAGAIDHEADRGVVVLEYLADLRQGDVLAGCTRAEAITLAKMLARLHAAWWVSMMRQRTHWRSSVTRSPRRVYGKVDSPRFSSKAVDRFLRQCVNSSRIFRHGWLWCTRSCGRAR